MQFDRSLQQKISFIERQFLDSTGYALNLFEPASFNEKIQWLKIFYNDPLMGVCSDKWAVRQYISEKVGERYLVPCLGVYDSVEKIPFECFSEPAVFKLTNGSGEVVFWHPAEKKSVVNVKKTLATWLEPGRNHYFYSYEWWYKKIPSRIICESVLGYNIADYKIMCFNGVPKLLFVVADRATDLKVTFFDTEWNRLPFRRFYNASEAPVDPPAALDEMINVARTLAKPFPFVRVDFYEIDGKVYVGELTFGPGNGMESFDPVDWDYTLGNYLRLPDRYKVEFGGNFIEGSARNLKGLVEVFDSFVLKVLKVRLPIYRKIVFKNPENSALSDVFKTLGARVVPSDLSFKNNSSGRDSFSGKSSDKSAGFDKDVARDLYVIDHPDDIDRFLGLTDGVSAHRCDVLLPLRPYFVGITEGLLSSMIARFQSAGYRVFGIDEIHSCIRNLDAAAVLAMMTSRHSTSAYYLLCIPEDSALSITFFSHSAELAGAERSLTDLILGLASHGVVCNTVLPCGGPLVAHLLEHGCGVVIPSEEIVVREGWWWADSGGGQQVYALSETRKEIERVLLPEIRTLAPDCIYSQTIVSPWGAFSAERLGVRHVVAAREYGVLDHGLRFIFGFERSMSALYETSDTIFCVTKDVRSTVFRSDPKNKAVVVYSGLDLTDIKAKSLMSDRVCRVVESGEALFKIGIFAGSIRGKGQIDLVRACNLLVRRGYQFKCYIVGPHDGALREEVRAAGLENRFELLGFQENPYGLMRQMNVVVSCSAREAFGRTIIEALSLGMPVIYTDSGGSREFYKDGEHGLAYPPGDIVALAAAFEEIIQNPVAAQRRAAKGGAFVRRKLNRSYYIRKIYQRLLRLKNSGRKSLRKITGGYGVSGLLLSDRPEQFRSRLYMRDSSGAFSDSRVLYGEAHSYGNFALTFSVSDNDCTGFRFDPVEGRAVSLELYSLVAKSVSGASHAIKDLDITANGDQCGDLSWSFLTNDPQVVVIAKEPVESVHISGRLLELPYDTLVRRIMDQDARFNSFAEELTQSQVALAAERHAREVERGEAIKQVEALTAWATSADGYAKSKVEEVEQLKREIADLNEKLTGYRQYWIFKFIPKRKL